MRPHQLLASGAGPPALGAWLHCGWPFSEPMGSVPLLTGAATGAVGTDPLAGAAPGANGLPSPSAASKVAEGTKNSVPVTAEL